MDNGKQETQQGQRFEQPMAVLAYDRGGTVYCRSMAEAMLRYGVPSTSMLKRLIDNGNTWRGYFTFDWASEEDHRQAEFAEYRKIVSSAIEKVTHSNRYPLPTAGKRQ